MLVAAICASVSSLLRDSGRDHAVHAVVEAEHVSSIGSKDFRMSQWRVRCLFAPDIYIIVAIYSKRRSANELWSVSVAPVIQKFILNCIVVVAIFR